MGETLDIRIALLLREKRIPLREFLTDFDRLRSGCITQAQLLKGLRAALDKEWGILNMSALEFGALASAFADVREPGSVRWREMCAAFDKVPYPRRVSSPPPDSPVSPRYAGTRQGGIYLSPAAADARATSEWRQETARTVESARASSRAADFGAHVGRLAGLAAGAALVESEAEVERELKREIDQLDAYVRACAAALAEGAEALDRLRELGGTIADLDADLAARRASALHRLRALTDGRPTRERTADGYVSALLAEVDAVNASRTELQAAALRSRDAQAELHARARAIDVARAHATYSMAVEEEVRAIGGSPSSARRGALGGADDGVLEGDAAGERVRAGMVSGGRVRASARADAVRARSAHQQPPAPDEPLERLVADMRLACNAARAVRDGAARTAERARASGAQMEERAESALEVKVDSTCLLYTSPSPRD